MTTDLEKQFFSTFEIQPREYKSCDISTFCPYPEKECGTDTCPYYRTYKVDYPAISDRILLELICIEFTENPYKCRGYTSNAEELKEYILNQFIHEFENDFYLDKEDVKQQVQALFNEG